MDRVHIITTGGTIEGLEYNTLEHGPAVLTATIQDFLKDANISIKYTLEKAFQKDSRFITSEDRLLLAERIVASDCDYVLITHGTLTMVETSKFLGRLGLDKTIVLVGALILGIQENTDAPFNLGYAIGSMSHLRQGVYIAMNGSIFSWENVKKNLEKNQFEREF